MDEGRSLGIGVQAPVSNHSKRLLLRALVVSVGVKVWNEPHQVGVRKMNESEPSMMHRESIIDVETRDSAFSWDKLRSYLITDLSGIRCRGGMSLTWAIAWNVGTCRQGVKGEVRAEITASSRVPIPGTGADQLVVAMKSVKADGAKGLSYSAKLVGQPLYVGGIYE